MKAGTLLASRYRLLEPLGAGGFATVWIAEDAQSGAVVAVKLLNEDRKADAEARARFARESRALAALSHPNIVRLIDVIETDGMLAVVMERLEGESLRAKLVRERKLAFRETAEIVGAVAAAVDSAHGQNLVHRDLKPENVFLVASQRGPASVRVLDFGIAKVLRPEQVGPSGIVTRIGTRLGTIAYMAPEQITGADAVDAAADVWAIGVIAFELLTGCRPFEAETETELVRRILVDGIPPVGVLSRDVPDQVDALVSACLRRDRARRPTARELVRVLGEARSAAG